MPCQITPSELRFVLDKTEELSDLTPSSYESGMVSALARYRQNALRHANALFDGSRGIPCTEKFDALPNMSSLLLTSLEELKVAEEELREQNGHLMDHRNGVEARLQRYRDLFQNAPAPAFITDVHGSIQEVNIAATALFRRDAAHLEHKPVQTLVPTAARDEFRRQLSRLQAESGVTDWRIVFHRTGDLPVAVSAAVSLVHGIGPTGGGGLYWMLRVLE